MQAISLFALTAIVSAVPPACAFAIDDDPYAPLKLYEGRWSVVSDQDGKTTAVENHCARTGLFFACEQVVNGKSAALIVFLPHGRTADGQTYRTQTLTAEAGAPRPWFTLTIDGERWTYAAVADGKPARQRTLNQFSGPDRIHFDVQNSKDGKTWTTKMSGEERRIP
jgi:hypothetical protein